MKECVSNVFSGLVADSTRCYVKHIEELCSSMEDKWSFIVADKDTYEKYESSIFKSLLCFSKIPTNHVTLRTLDDVYMEEFLNCSNDIPILLQAWSGYHEQFKRFRDILPKLANTTDIADMRIKDASDVR